MGENQELVTIIILAMVALFIGLRLRSVLGKHRADEPPAQHTDSYQGRPQAKADPRAATGFGNATFDNPEEEDASGVAHPAIRKIFRREGQAGYNKFLDGAKSAYRATLEGFWSGEMGIMEPYIDPDVLRGFKGAIAERNKEGHILENRLIEITSASLDDAEIVDSTAEITIRFESEIVAVMKDRYGKLLEGSMKDTMTVTDIWTFARNLHSTDPNWVLIATESG